MQHPLDFLDEDVFDITSLFFDISHGIYFLLNEDIEVYYVGKSTFLPHRIYQHINTQCKLNQRPKFNRIFIYPVSTEVVLDEIEQAFIQYFRPRGNKDYNDKSITRKELKDIIHETTTIY